jgi:hypothetical protein
MDEVDSAYPRGEAESGRDGDQDLWSPECMNPFSNHMAYINKNSSRGADRGQGADGDDS